MRKLTQTEIIEQIDKDTTAVEIIRNHENQNECSVIINDRFFSCGFECEFNFDLIIGIKNAINDNGIAEIPVIMFVDNELNEAWKQSYLAGGIPEEDHDRRVIFHAYNDMNEMFCIDQSLLWDITDEFKGTDHELTEEKCAWRWNMIKWYKNHLI